VLYAAARRADNQAGVRKRPSDQLEKALRKLAGRGRFTRVTSWRAWRGAVRTKRPQMLVVLGHTEVQQAQTVLEIGKGSFLAQPRVDVAVLAGPEAVAPLVVLLACATATAGDAFGRLPATFTDKGAAAVVATLTKLKGAHGAAAAVAVVDALGAGLTEEGTSLGEALAAARRSLVGDGLLVGLLLLSHGDVDVRLTA
jgi:hypothetical protein